MCPRIACHIYSIYCIYKRCMDDVNVLYVQYMSVNKIPSTIFPKITVGQLFRKVKM